LPLQTNRQKYAAKFVRTITVKYASQRSTGRVAGKSTLPHPSLTGRRLQACLPQTGWLMKSPTGTMCGPYVF
jgi:hypothetical protein